ncbi:putative cell wall-associated hydrolase [Helicobacter cinaedi PAGU611]|uniref:Cell wall-associated hydrolase n=1 Tax=Helicobacter cinaedi CCUG 18818 = ATCC BAA-847 TaxID=537971 RepID=A0AAI8MNL4_9HELI|nr:SH3 domain-containing protein [Helicobacter cinaedi]EFR46755.1 NlpC/P60 family protein [Helicobacter cinaedi CCUG 18818 = ATCC BAA-847]QOQ91713.1 SH3 domain-containing protein [Helicobacter cinaedi]BAM12233.1 putative cell wall-associated hydrolase [Helicobacter cinaedi PAGU611]BAM32212.1 putative cell wall-associated hydrolase [Helicobacter cinaedi CCUG 18818 = ATCC BAA-847]BBB19889.1 probable exported protein STY2149 [Helicobacter cinaedi]
MTFRPAFIIYAFFLILGLNACADKVIPSHQVKDLQTLPQDALFYLPADLESKRNDKVLAKLQKDYLQKHFSPWHQKPNPKKNEVFWIVPSLQNLATNESKTKSKNKSYGEDLQEISPQIAQNIIDSMNLSSYPNQNQKAIITTTTAVRAVPTNKPLFNKINGYPFDRWQNSLIFANTPVLITHISKDKQWVHIQSSFVYGWVESTHLATLTSKQISEIESYTQYISPKIDKIPLYNSQHHFISQARIGQIFPKYGTQLKQSVGVAVYVRLPNGEAKREQVYLPNEMMKPFPQIADSKAIAEIINTMIGDKYGWGGFLESRDCSAFVRDIFTNFGIHLPRNSKAQVYYGNNQVDLSNLSRKEKESYIIANATPYQTILWLQGHIMLYIGEYEGRAIVAHSAWSATTGRGYENMLGGVVITSLYVGEEHNSLFAKSPLLLDKVKAMSNISQLAEKITAPQEFGKNLK